MIKYDTEKIEEESSHEFRRGKRDERRIKEIGTIFFKRMAITTMAHSCGSDPNTYDRAFNKIQFFKKFHNKYLIYIYRMKKVKKNK